MPPLQALLALHGLWLLVFIPSALWASFRWPARRVKSIGSLLIVVGLAGLAWFIGRESQDWYRNVPQEYRQYFVQRVAFVLGTTADVPVVQVLSSGVLMEIIAWWRGRKAVP
jgi:hypothetical protein